MDFLFEIWALAGVVMATPLTVGSRLKVCYFSPFSWHFFFFFFLDSFLCHYYKGCGLAFELGTVDSFFVWLFTI